jgi:hypothetical protein
MSARARFHPWYRIMDPPTGEERIVGWHEATTEDDARSRWAVRVVRDLWSEVAHWLRCLAYVEASR